MLFDILVAYGRSNTIVVRRLIQTILKIEPKYKNDLIEGLNFLKNALNTIQQKTEANESSTSFEDLALYTLDCAYTIHSLIQVIPEAHELCRNLSLEQNVTNFYDSTIPMLYKNMWVVDPKSIGIKYLNNARVELLAFFRDIVNTYLEEVLTNP